MGDFNINAYGLGLIIAVVFLACCFIGCLIGCLIALSRLPLCDTGGGRKGGNATGGGSGGGGGDFGGDCDGGGGCGGDGGRGVCYCTLFGIRE